MAQSKEYAYYLRGNKIAIVEKDFRLTDGLNYSHQEGDGLGISTGHIQWKSPLTTVTDALEIEYAYSPTYHINDIEDKSTAITGYDESTGLLKFTGSGLSTDAAIKHIVIKGSEKWNGLHEINTLNVNYWLVNTKYNGAAVTESGITAYTDIDVLNNEADEIPLQPYLASALVYYVKGKLAEDSGDIKMKEYNMREFRKMVERHESSRIHGSRTFYSGVNAIR